MNTPDYIKAGLKLFDVRTYYDDRGFFCELWRDEKLALETGISNWGQANLSRSKKNVLRGLHYQVAPHAQAKLIMVTHGKVWDLCVDLRKDSPTYKKHFSFELSAEKPQLLFIPNYFAHGFCVLSESADFFYRCSELYDPACERGLLWNDKSLDIKWPIENPIISQRDLEWVSGSI